MRISRQFVLGVATGASLIFIFGFVPAGHSFDQPKTITSSIPAGAYRLTIGMKESEVLKEVGKTYNLRRMRDRVDGTLWWATEKGQTDRPSLFLGFQQGSLAWAQKKWFDERQPGSGAEVLRAVNEIMSDFVSQQHAACTPGVASQRSENESSKSRETELRCGDLQLETILLTTESRRDAQVEVNEVLVAAPNAHR